METGAFVSAAAWAAPVSGSSSAPASAGSVERMSRLRIGRWPRSAGRMSWPSERIRAARGDRWIIRRAGLIPVVESYVLEKQMATEYTDDTDTANCKRSGGTAFGA